MRVSEWVSYVDGTSACWGICPECEAQVAGETMEPVEIVLGPNRAELAGVRRRSSRFLRCSPRALSFRGYLGEGCCGRSVGYDKRPTQRPLLPRTDWLPIQEMRSEKGVESPQ
jgi:hypothetical protein